MFRFLGKNVSRHPWIFITAWIVLVVLGAGSALWGFGQGNLFSRMEANKSMVPGSESDKVVQAIAKNNKDEEIVAVVSGIPLVLAESETANLRTQLQAISGVKEVVDPLTIEKFFQQQIATEKQKQLEQALKTAEPQIAAEVEKRIAPRRSALEQLPPAQAAEVEKQLRASAQSGADTYVRQQAEEKIDAELAKVKNPAAYLKSSDGFAVVVRLYPGKQKVANEKVEKVLQDFSAQLQGKFPGHKLNILSTKIAERDIMSQVAKDLVSGEAIGLPLALFLLIIVFGGLIAAGLPLAAALVSIATAMGIVWTITFSSTNVDSFVLNILSIIGLALSIDYGLLVVSRFREETGILLNEQGYAADGSRLPEDVSEIVRQGVIITVATAGRTVSFSAITIACAISSLLVMEAPMLSMIAIGGVVVSLFAVTTAITLVPALIQLLGSRLLRPSRLSKIPFFNRLFHRFGDATTEKGFFSALAQRVHAHPWPVLISVIGVLVIAALPLHGLNLRSHFVEYIPKESTASKALYEIDKSYPQLQTASISVLAEIDKENTADLQAEIKDIAGVSRLGELEDLSGSTLIPVYTGDSDPVGKDVTKIVKEIRNLHPGYPIYVGGAAALQYDFIQSLISGLPGAIAIILISVLVLLFLMTGSLVAPLKALVINSLSLLAGLGITTFIFNNGLLTMPHTPGIETFVIAVAAAFGFGLAMDYEVFLVARIKEYWDSGCDNDTAVEKGLQRSGRIITAAAAIIIAVFVGFIFGNLVPVKQIGMALATIVLVDATLVRMLLVPAIMTLLGKWNWWAPKPLQKLHTRIAAVIGRGIKNEKTTDYLAQVTNNKL